MIASLHTRINKLLATQPQVLVAIDGDCAAGKSTLARQLQTQYDCSVLPMDHFFLRPERRTPERLAEPGGGIDYERFKAEVLTPLQAGEAFIYRPFDCQAGGFGAEIVVPLKPISVVEGTYSLHSTLADAYHIKVFLTVDPAEQLRRIAARNGEALLQRFKTEWIPMEKRYFAHFGIMEQCDYVL